MHGQPNKKKVSLCYNIYFFFPYVKNIIVTDNYNHTTNTINITLEWEDLHNGAMSPKGKVMCWF
jgi:hypothetical protein